MVKKDKFQGLTKVCNEIIRVSKEHSYLWDDEGIWGDNKWKILYLAHGFIAQDETFHIYVKKDENKFRFYGKNFCTWDEKEGLGAKDAASRIRNRFSNFNMSTEEIRNDFYDSLKKPLGSYIANKSLEKYLNKK